jgi:hypothetical protein
LFSTLETADPPVFRQFNSAYCTFLNTYGVWVNPTSATTFDRTYTINFPVTTFYSFIASADNSADIYLAQTVDGVFTNQLAITTTSFTQTYTNGFFLTAGVKQVRIVGTNTGGPGAVALTIGGAANFAGSFGGYSGGSGSSGAGGGGGGGTVVLLNGNPLGAGGGGGGGGGGGNVGAAAGQNAPGDRGQASIGINEGQSGSNKLGDGGGAGGGGGGWGGGNGGTVPGGDQGGYAGAFGGSSGAGQNPSGRFPGGLGGQYYRDGVAVGGASGGNQGTAGYAVFEFDVPGTIVNTAAGGWNPATETWIKINGTWVKAATPYIKQGGIWYPLNGYAPVFQNVPGRFGASPRAAELDVPPEPPPVPPVSYAGDRGGYDPTGLTPCTPGVTVGDVGCTAPGTKIVCTMMNEEYGFGSYRNAIWLRYSASMPNAEVYQLGYHRLFLPLVAYAKGTGTTNHWVKTTLEHIARHRTSDIYLQMKGKRRDKLGRIYRAVLEPLCYLAGKL